MYDKEIYEKSYYYELDRIDKIHIRMTIPLTILTLIGGAIINMIPKSFKMLASGQYGYIGIIGAIIFLIILFLISIYLALRSYFGYGYGYIDNWNIIDKYETDLIEYYDNDLKKVKEELDQYYISKLKESRDRNFKLNNKRQRYLFWTNIFISIQLPLLIIVYTISSYISL